MKVYTRVVMDMNFPDLPVMEEESFEYEGPVALCWGDADGGGLGLGGDGNDGHGGGEGGAQGVGGGIGGSPGGGPSISQAEMDSITSDPNLGGHDGRSSQTGFGSGYGGGVSRSDYSGNSGSYGGWKNAPVVRHPVTKKVTSYTNKYGNQVNTAYGNMLGIHGKAAANRTMPGMTNMGDLMSYSGYGPQAEAMNAARRENSRTVQKMAAQAVQKALLDSGLKGRALGKSQAQTSLAFSRDPVGTMSAFGMNTEGVQSAMSNLDPLGAMFGSPMTPAQAQAVLEGKLDENGNIKASSMFGMMLPALMPFGITGVSTLMNGTAQQIAQAVASATFGPKQAAKMAGGLINTARAAQVAGVGPGPSNAVGSGGAVGGGGMRTAAAPASFVGGRSAAVPGLSLQWLRGRTAAIPGLVA